MFTTPLSVVCFSAGCGSSSKKVFVEFWLLFCSSSKSSCGFFVSLSSGSVTVTSGISSRSSEAIFSGAKFFS